MKKEIITIENGIVSIPQSNKIWMTQYELADLFECFVARVGSNIRAVLKNGTLNEFDVCRICQSENGNLVEQYNLEIIIALVFRINTHKTKIFREWIIKKAVTNTAGSQILMIKEWGNCDFPLN